MIPHNKIRLLVLIGKSVIVITTFNRKACAFIEEKSLIIHLLTISQIPHFSTHGVVIFIETLAPEKNGE